MKLRALTAAALLAVGPAYADPAGGIWKTQPDDNGNFGHVQISECGPAVCGVLVRAFDGSGAARPSEHLNKRILWDMAAKGGGSYSGGKIFAPDRGKTYNSKMTLAGSTLKVSGCVLGICREQTWKRVQ
ncbi:MAG: DUF2147 domain-containing protein [Pseudomonadota bacterium]